MLTSKSMITKKTFPILLSVLAIASIASTAVLGNAQTVYAGGFGCNVDPVMVDAGILVPGASTEASKTIECSEDVLDVDPDSSDCDNKGIDAEFTNIAIDTFGVWTADETIENIAAVPGKTTCTVSFFVTFLQGTDTVTQTIMVTSTHPPLVGGEFLPIDSAALLVAGSQTSAVWILSALAVIGSVAFGALYLTTKRS